MLPDFVMPFGKSKSRSSVMNVTAGLSSGNLPMLISSCARTNNRHANGHIQSCH